MTTFLDFIKTGRADPFRCGMTYGEACEVIEDLEGDSYVALGPYGTNAVSVVKTGPLELTFHRAGKGVEPTLISIRHGGRGAGFELDPDNAADDFRQWVDHQGVRVVGGQTHGLAPHLILESGVKVEFSPQGLVGATYSPKIAPDVKQVTLTLSKADLEKVERAAAAAGTTLAKICSEWIRERASTLNQPAETGAR